MFRRFWERSRKSKQDELTADDDDEALLASASTDSLAVKIFADDRGGNGRIVAIRTALLCTALYLCIGIWVGLTLKNTRLINDVDKLCLNHISQYSPVVREVRPNWHTIRYNGTFFHENIYRQAPSPEVDAAWEALGVDYRSIVVPEREAKKTGLRQDQVKISQIYGGGFPANIEGLHHLHCLNLLRKALWWNYEYYTDRKEGAFVNSEYVVRYHVTHCMDILRQQLMCTTDIGVLGQVWYQPEDEPNPIPFVDFNTEHRCRDFEAIRAWAEAHQLPPETEVDMSQFYEPPTAGDNIYPEIP